MELNCRESTRRFNSREHKKHFEKYKGGNFSLVFAVFSFHIYRLVIYVCRTISSDFNFYIILDFILNNLFILIV